VGEKQVVSGSLGLAREGIFGYGGSVGCDLC